MSERIHQLREIDQQLFRYALAFLLSSAAVVGVLVMTGG